MTRILALAGKQGAGKDTCAKFLVRNATELFGKGGVVKTYHFADSLKQLLADYFGLDPDLLWGTQEQKKTFTHLQWENLPHYTELVQKVRSEVVTESLTEGSIWEDDAWGEEINRRLPKGPMTVREVLEQVGTEIFRRMMGDVWIQHCLRRIRQEGASLAIIADCRFPDEVEAVQRAGGKALRLTRTTREASSNAHASSVGLDDFVGFNGVLPNEHLSIGQTNQTLLTWLWDWGWIRPEVWAHQDKNISFA